MNAPVALAPEAGTYERAEDEALYEVIDGERRELPPMGAFEASIASTLDQFLGHFARSHNLGRAYCGMLFDLAAVKRQRRPDVAFVSADRWDPAVPVPRADAWDAVPNLAVEVVSPKDLMADVLLKVSEYFQAGAELVWLVLPDERLVHVYRSPAQIQVLTPADQLDGGPALPGFQMPVATLFPGQAPPTNGDAAPPAAAP
jgi:Uma2 family endonuclease